MVCVCDAVPRFRTEGCLRDVLGDLQAREAGVCAQRMQWRLGRREGGHAMSHEGNVETSRCCLLGSRKKRESSGYASVSPLALACFGVFRYWQADVDERMTASDSRRVGAYEMSSRGGAGADTPTGCVCLVSVYVGWHE